jgi:hypothetical protein
MIRKFLDRRAERDFREGYAWASERLREGDQPTREELYASEVGRSPFERGVVAALLHWRNA